MTESTPPRARYDPLVLVETKDLPREEWLAWRRKGIGGSDVAGIMGISPFRTARDVYYDKLNIVSVEEDESNWVAKEMGNLLEPLTAKIFQKKTGYQIYQVKKMFYHPKYTFMLADVDYFITLPDGTTAILEIKTTDRSNLGEWTREEKETVPVYYEVQGRHYMAVTDIDRVFFCCFYGRDEDSILIREIKRDFSYEEELIYLEQYFWEENVRKKSPPPYLEDGKLVMESVLNHIAPADLKAPEVTFDLDMKTVLMRYLELQEEKKSSEVQSKMLENELQRLKALLIAKMGSSCTAVCEQAGQRYTVTYKPVLTPRIDKDGLLRLKLQYPEIYQEFVGESKARRFHVKVSAAEAA